jgi:Cof subfamily protein (haloacid dehalogenase superfamily)
LIGIDIDGTLLDSHGRMPLANRDAIHAAVAAGIHVALVTGRSYPFARPVAEPLPSAITLIVSSGAVERAMDGSTLARRLLDRAAAHAVLEATRSFRHSAALIFDRDRERQMVHETMDWDHPGRRNYWLRNQALISRAEERLEDELVEDPIEVMFSGGVDDMRVIAQALRGLGDDSFAVSLTEYVHRDFSLVDVTSPEATKGRALAWRAGQLGLAREEIMAVGDNFNDLEMLEAAGTPIVMANAVDDLKSRGYHLTGHQDAAGLAEAIRRFALP